MTTHCPFITARPVTFTLEDGTEKTVEVYGYVCRQPLVTPLADACADHIDRSCWGTAA
jgi:hypothetical protein